jgi:glycerophosphoryl diester phosphodiesterase
MCPVHALHVQVLAVHHEMVDEAFTRDMHAAGKQVHVWTVSSSPVMKAVLDAGVDALVTNHPAAAVAAVKAYQEKCARRRQR